MDPQNTSQDPTSLPPLPASFINNVFVVSQDELRSLHSLQPFKQRWRKFWAEIAKEHRSLTQLESFINKGGLNPLEDLAGKGADPNFILLLLIKYLWVENINPYERKEPMIKINQQSLQAVRYVHCFYEEFYKKSSLEGYEWIRELPWGGEPNEQAESFLSEAEEKIRRYLESKDLPKLGMRSPPKDKVNRVVFTVYHHLKQKTSGTGPHWQVFLELLLAAGALERNIKKKKTPWKYVPDNPDRRISSHIRSFQTHHPKEARIIQQMMAQPNLFLPKVRKGHHGN